MADRLPNEDARGNIPGATYQLVQLQTDGTKRVINFTAQVLAILDVSQSEWSED